MTSSYRRVYLEGGFGLLKREAIMCIPDRRVQAAMSYNMSLRPPFMDFPDAFMKKNGVCRESAFMRAFASEIGEIYRREKAADTFLDNVNDGIIVLDMLPESYMIYLEAARLELSEEDFEVLKKLFKSFQEEYNYAETCLKIFLVADESEICKRVKNTFWGAVKGMDPRYVKAINQAYVDFARQKANAIIDVTGMRKEEIAQNVSSEIAKYYGPS